jgi:hypothetical protein
MFTVSAPEGELTTEVFVAERAWAATEKGPVCCQLCVADVVPVPSQPL